VAKGGGDGRRSQKVQIYRRTAPRTIRERTLRARVAGESRVALYDLQCRQREAMPAHPRFNWLEREVPEYGVREKN